MNLRTGIGYDVHRLTEDRKLILGGVCIPFHKGLLGHSDADVLTHAIIDALLGATGKGDIGSHFPDNDEQYKGISSLKLLEHVHELLTNDGYVIINIDSIIIAQKPRLAPYIGPIKTTLAGVLRLTSDQINVKAKTEEGLGFTGSGDGIAAQAVCLIEKR